MAKKKEEVNTELVVKAQTAFTISNEISQIVSKIIENGGECDDETFTALKEWQAALEVKAGNIGLVKARLESDIEYYKLIEESAKNRRKTTESAIERLKKYLADCMATADVKSIKGDLFSFSLVAGRSKAVVENSELLPFAYTEIETLIKPKNKEIKEALEAGYEIPGAHIEFGSDYVMIRAAGTKKENE